jgi:alginate O-acetyltransferase complex protein AlgI
VLGKLLVDPAFAQAGQVSAARHWLGLVGYAGQVFCDFAGYSEMAIGAALLFGVKLPENFDAPFLATNILGLWRRWHMSLTGWLFDYVYSPLMTGTSWLRGRLDLGFVLTFLVSGLWHGAAWTFVAWGGLQGLGLAIHRRYDEAYRGLCRKDRAWVARRKTRGYLLASWAITQAFFVLTLVPFRARSFGEAAAFARGLAKGGTLALPGLGLRDLLNLLVCAALFLAYHLFRGRSLPLPAVARGVIYGLVIVYLAIFMPLASGTFIYAQF